MSVLHLKSRNIEVGSSLKYSHPDFAYELLRIVRICYFFLFLVNKCLCNSFYSGWVSSTDINSFKFHSLKHPLLHKSFKALVFLSCSFQLLSAYPLLISYKLLFYGKTLSRSKDFHLSLGIRFELKNFKGCFSLQATCLNKQTPKIYYGCLYFNSVFGKKLL